MAEGWFHLPYRYKIRDDGKVCRVFGDVWVPTDDVAEFLELTGMRWDENAQRSKMRFFDSIELSLFKLKFGIE